MHCQNPLYFRFPWAGPDSANGKSLNNSNSSISVTEICEKSAQFAFFELAEGTILTFRQCNIQNIRVRADAFVRLKGGQIVFQDTEIWGLDFVSAFLSQTDSSSTSSISFANCSISGLNRDHRYNSKGDSGLIVASRLASIDLVDVLMEDNFLMPNSDKPGCFLKVDFLTSMRIIRTEIRRCMGSFELSFSPSEPSEGLLWADSTYEYSHSDDAPNWVLVFKASTQVNITSVTFAYNTNMYSNGVLLSCTSRSGTSQVHISDFYFADNFAISRGDGLLKFDLISNLTIEKSVLRNNGDYYASNAPFNIYQYMLDSILLDNSSDVYTEKINVDATSSCEYLLMVFSAEYVLIASSSLVSSDGLCLNLYGHRSSGKKATTIATFQDCYFTSPYGYSLDVQISDTDINRILVLLNCVFRDTQWGGVYFYSYMQTAAGVYAENCTFQNVGNFAGNEAAIDIYGGGHLTLRNCTFINCQGSRSGAIFFLQLSQNPDPLSSVYDATLVIDNCYFFDNRSPQQGGDLYLFSPDGSAPISMRITNSYFYNSAAKLGGGSLSLNNIAIKEGIISDCRFEGGFTNKGGIVGIEHSSGVLALSRLIFEGISAPTASLIQIMTPADSEETQVYTTISDMIVSNCVYMAAIFLESSSGQPTLHTFRNEFLNNYGTSIWNDKGILTDIGSIFSNNTSDSSPCLFQDSTSQATFTNAVFERNRGIEQSGVMEVHGPGTVSIFIGCEFMENVAGKIYGIGHLEQQCRIKFENCRFEGNSALGTSMLDLQNINQFVVITDSIMSRNKGDGLFNIGFSRVYMRNVTVSENVPLTNEAGFTLMQSWLYIEDSRFENIRGRSGCLVNSYIASTVRIHSSTISNVECSREVFYLASGSSLAICDSDLTAFRTETASIISITDRGKLNFTSTRIRNAAIRQVSGRDDQAFITANDADVRIIDSVIEHLGMLVIYGADLSCLLIANTSVHDVEAPRNSAAVLMCLNCLTVTIHNSSICGVTGGSAGGVLIDGYSSVSLDSTVFSDIIGVNHGAIVMVSTVSRISNCTFRNNSAAENINSQGGALYLQTSQASITDSLFLRNRAQNGGALYWDSLQPNITTTEFRENQAEYGANIASLPSTITLLTSGKFISASGQTYSSHIAFVLTDAYGQIIENDNSTEAWLQPKSTHTLLTGPLKATAAFGRFNFSGFMIVDDPGTTIDLVVTSTTITTANFSVTVPFFLRLCEVGEIYHEGKCLECLVGSYSLELNSTQCLPCPNAAICQGGARVFPVLGAWRPDPQSDRVFTCFREESCRGSSNFTSLTGVCDDGYTGHLCESCQEGYSRTIRDVCQPCSSSRVWYITTTISALGLLLILVITVRSSLRNTQGRHLKLGLIMKMLMNYFQMISLIRSFRLNWPESYLGTMNSQDVLGLVYGQLLSFDCSIPKEAWHPAFIKLFAVVTLPLVFMLVGLIPWLLWSCIRKTAIQKEKIIGTLVIILIFLHPVIVKVCFSFFNCFEILPNEKWMREEMAIRCWKAKHLHLSLAVALPGAIIWGIAAPAIILGLLIKQKKQLSSPKVRDMLGFLYVGYDRSKLYFWEFVILYRKMAIAGCYVFLSTLSAATQALIVLTLLLISLGIQLKYEPFLYPKANSLEVRSILVSTLIIYSGLYFVAESMDHGAKLFLGVTILAAHVTFLVSWSGVVLAITLKYLGKRHPHCFAKVCWWSRRFLASLRESALSNLPLSASTELNDKRKEADVWLRSLFLHKLQSKPNSTPILVTSYRDPNVQATSY